MIFIIGKLLLCLVLAAQTCDASVFLTWQYGLWCSGNQTPQNSSYNTNLKTLLSFLSSNATKQDRYYSTNTTAINGAANSETIYGQFECRGDTTLRQCTRCVNKALSNLPPKECPNDKRVMLMWYYWYMDCSIWYSNESFQSNLEERVRIGVRNHENITTIIDKVEGQGFMRLVDHSLHELANMSSSLGTGIRKYFKRNTAMVYKNFPLYTMAHCMPTLSLSDCKACLSGVVSELWACCNGSIGGRAVSPGCYTRFELYHFYKSAPSMSRHLTKGYSRKEKLLLTSLLGAFLTSAAILLLLLFGLRVYSRKRTSNIYDGELDDEIRSTLESLQYDFNTIKTATCKFSADSKVGQGGFGEVYKGKLKSGQEIAVKRLSKSTAQGIEQFKNEVVVVAKLQHNNLVKLLGYCLSSKEMMLVYEFLPNSSLDRFLFGQSKKAILDWDTRFKIIVGIARGLLYLHEDSRLKVIHRDLKSSNILLDEHMNPKISDFGLAKHFGVDQTQGDTKRIAGTYGYMAPEYAITGRYSSKSDVYSFGVITLEILSGRRNSFFVESLSEEELLPCAWRLWKEEKAFDLVDAALKNNFAKEEVLKCFHIGLLCVQENANERPAMTSIVAALNGQIIDFPMPKPSQYLGSIANVKKLDQSESSRTYTGSQTITQLYPRE